LRNECTRTLEPARALIAESLTLERTWPPEARVALPPNKWSAIFHRMDSVILASEALKLPALERAQIIDALWRSLDPAEQSSVDQAWLAESRDRMDAYREGRLKPLKGEETLRDIEAGLRP
jgi:putative addiction module component (TIGR02574 family)